MIATDAPPRVPRTRAVVRELVPIVLLSAVWIAMVLLVNVRGEFPLNDDWAYTRTSLRLATTGEYRPDHHVEMTLFTQALYGAGVIRLAGFSFTALRLSTAALGLLAILATYAMCREAMISRAGAAFGSLVLLANPLFLNLSVTFMTDVPFTALTAVMAWLAVRALARARVADVAALSIVAVLAVLLRQVAIVGALAFAAGRLSSGRNRSAIVEGLTPVICALVAWQAFDWWLRAGGRAPAIYGQKIGTLGEVVLGPLLWDVVGHAKRLLNISFYMGVFTAPIAAWALWPERPRAARQWTLVAACVIVLALVALSGKVAPWGSSILYDTGIGPPMLRDVDRGFTIPAHAPRWIWRVVTITAAAFLLLTSYGVWRRLRQVLSAPELPFDRALFVSAVTMIAVYLAPLVVTSFYDRYLVALVPWALLLFAPQLRERRPPPGRLIAVGLLVLSGSFSVAATHDWLSFNRARWQAIRHLLDERHAAVDTVDGGFEYTGWYRPGVNWREVPNPQYVVALGEMPGYRTVARFSYGRWLFSGAGEVRALERGP